MNQDFAFFKKEEGVDIIKETVHRMHMYVCKVGTGTYRQDKFFTVFRSWAQHTAQVLS